VGGVRGKSRSTAAVAAAALVDTSERLRSAATGEGGRGSCRSGWRTRTARRRTRRQEQNRQKEAWKAIVGGAHIQQVALEGDGLDRLRDETRR